MDREPQPSDGPEYHSHHAAWEVRQSQARLCPDVTGGRGVTAGYARTADANQAATSVVPYTRPYPQPYVSPTPPFPPYTPPKITSLHGDPLERIAIALERIASNMERHIPKFGDARD